MTVRYRSATLGEFIEHHSYDVSRGGMFIKTPSPFPPGTLLKFEVKIAGEQRVMQGVGRVVWKRDRPSEETGEPAGMGIKFIKIDDSSKSVIEKLVEARGPGSGAFEASPDSAAAPGNMFPTGAAEPPAPEDRTVMKPATELLNEALVKTGQSPVLGGESEAPPASSEGADRGPMSGPPTSLAPTTVAPETAAPVTAGPATVTSANPRESQTEGSDKRAAPRGSVAEAGRNRSPSAGGAGRRKDEESSGGRALALLLVAALVMAGIFLLTKKSSEPAAEEQTDRSEATGLSTPPAVASPEPLEGGPLGSTASAEDEPSEATSPEASASVAPVVPSASASTSAPSTSTPSTAPSASASSAPLPKPAPKPKPKPKPVASAPLGSEAPPAPESVPAPAPPTEPESN